MPDPAFQPHHHKAIANAIASVEATAEGWIETDVIDAIVQELVSLFASDNPHYFDRIAFLLIARGGG